MGDFVLILYLCNQVIHIMHKTFECKQRRLKEFTEINKFILQKGETERHRGEP